MDGWLVGFLSSLKIGQSQSIDFVEPISLFPVSLNFKFQEDQTSFGRVIRRGIDGH